MTISIQTQKRKFGREWLGNKDQKARQGQFRFSFLLSFSPSMQFHSCDTDQFCISETAGVLQWRAGPSKDYSYTKHRVKLNPLYSLSHVWTKKIKKKSSRKVSRSGSPTEMVELRRRCQGQGSVGSVGVVPFQHNSSTHCSPALSCPQSLCLLSSAVQTGRKKKKKRKKKGWYWFTETQTTSLGTKICHCKDWSWNPEVYSSIFEINSLIL